MSINLNQCTGVCHNCVKHYISKYRIQKGCGKTFEVECSGIPIKYIPDSILSSLGGDTSSIVAMLDPVTWAAKYLDWHCVDPDGEIWKRKTAEGTLPSESRPYDPILAKQGRSIFHRPYQLEMLACSSRRKVFRCGRQLGKTECLCIAILYALWTKGNFKIVLIAPYQSQIEMIFGRLMSAIQGSSQLSNSVAHSVKAPSYKIEMNNGSQIIGFTAGTRSGQDAGAARGQPANMLVFDEADYLSPGDIGATLATIVNSPSATVWMSSTPTGRREKFYETCHNPLYKEFYFPSQVNPNWGESEEKYYRSEYTEDQYKHEILAEFGEQEEGVYQVKYVEAAQSNYTYEQMKPTRSWTYMMGVDWNDIKIGTTIAIVGFNPQDNKFKVVDKHIISKGERTQLSACNKIAELNRLWFPDYIYVDRGFGACVGPDTLIQTHSGVKEISEIIPGDMVLTSTGEFCSVKDKVIATPKEAYSIRPSKCLPTTISYCHPFLVYRTKKRFDDKIFNENKLQWLKCPEINKELDFVAIPKRKLQSLDPVIDLTKFINMEGLLYDDNHIWSESSNRPDTLLSRNILSLKGSTSTSTIGRIRRKKNVGETLNSNEEKVNKILTKLYGDNWFITEILKFKRFLDITSKEFQSILGWYISEGNVNKCSVEITQKDKKYMEHFDEMIQFTKKMFPSVTVDMRENGSKRVAILGKVVSRLFETLGGKYSQNKHLHPYLFQFDLPIMVRCFLYGDGHDMRTHDDIGLQISLTSPHFVMQLRQYFIDHGILPSLYKVQKREENYQDQLRIDIGGNSDIITKVNQWLDLGLPNPSRIDRRKYIETPNYLLTPIESFEKIGLVDGLIDIEVDQDHSFCGNGFILHNTQVEVLHEFGARALQSQGPNSPDARLRQIVKEYDFGSAIEIHDLFSKQEVKKSAKPFLVDNSVRRFESLQIQYPKSDTHYTEQLLGYTIQRVSMTGLPVYQASERAGDHFLDAVNLALIAFLLEKTAYGKPTYTYDIAIAGKFGDPEGPHLDKNIVGRVSKDHSSDRSSLFKKEERLITSTPQLPACNTSKTSNLPLWSWPGWSRDLPAPKSKNHNNRRQFRPHRVKF